MGVFNHIILLLGIILQPTGNRKNHRVVWSKNLNRDFSEEELDSFFSVIDNKKHLFCFQMQAYLGLRISEAVKVNMSDIDFKRKTIRIYAEKTKETDFLHLHDRILKILQDWIRNNLEEIEKHKGYLLYSDYRNNHISRDTMRNFFRLYLKKAQLDDVYVELYTVGGQCNGMAKSRKLRRLSTHSLRHYYITKIYKKTLNPVATQKCARHKNFKSTDHYINLTDKDAEEALDKAFGEKENRIPLSTSL